MWVAWKVQMMAAPMAVWSDVMLVAGSVLM